MSILYDYINYWFYTQPEESQEKNNESFLIPLNISENNLLSSESIPKPPPAPKQKTRRLSTTKLSIVSTDLLKSIKLKSITDYPGPARNMPDISKKEFNLCMLSHGNLDAILNVKLKKTNFPKRKTIFPPRSPLLLELHETIGVVN